MPIVTPTQSASSFLKDLDYSVIQQCMHCGMCLPTCPTYDLTKQERNSPRGRIALMRAIADGDMEATKEFGKEMYYCLGCLACTTSCPAGVDYTKLFENARAEVESSKALDRPMRRWIRHLTLGWLFMDLRRLELLGWLIRFYEKSGMREFLRMSGIMKFLPEDLRDMEAMTPTIRDQFSAALIPPVLNPTGGNQEGRRYRVALLTGCAQDLIFSDVNLDTATALAENGCEVHTPAEQNCCGSLHAHNGEYHLAQELARRNIDQFPPESFDAIISNAGGCGSHLKHYADFLKDDPAYAHRAHLWDDKVVDIHEWLTKIKFRAPTNSPWEDANLSGRKVTYHHSCHLCHGQKVVHQPQQILKSIPGVEMIELPEAQWCCGSAGVYNITQPQTARQLLDRKMKHVESTGASTLCTGNPGCQLQIQNGARQTNLSLDVHHPVSLLAKAYRKNQATNVVP